MDCEFSFWEEHIWILNAVKDEVWTGPEDSGKAKEETHLTSEGKEEILTERSEAK
jgi:hypothetical protein